MKKLTLHRSPLGSFFTDKKDNTRAICAHTLRRFFSLPPNVSVIDLLVQDRPAKGFVPVVLDGYGIVLSFNHVKLRVDSRAWIIPELRIWHNGNIDARTVYVAIEY